MKLTRERRFTINMGNYESFTSSASIEVDLETFASEENPYTAAAKFADEKLDAILASDLKEAKELTDVRNSYVLSWGNS